MVLSSASQFHEVYWFCGQCGFLKPISKMNICEKPGFGISARYLVKVEKKPLILVGLEPTISGSVDRCLIHWATGPKKLRKNLKRFYKSSFCLPALCQSGVLRYPGSNLGRVMVQLKCS